ncbi:hypothetical protein [Actinokineospora xionganensis]|nr:hypothetical protein [Actinokineospora xionganensis]
MPADLILNFLIDFLLAVLILISLVITCGAMLPPRRHRGPHS